MSLLHILSPPSGHGPEVPTGNKYQHALCDSVLPIITDVKEKMGAGCLIMAVSDSERQSLPGRSDKTGDSEMLRLLLEKKI